MIQWSVVYTVTNRKTQKVYVGVHLTHDEYWPRGNDKWRPNVVSINNDVSLYGAEHFHITVIHCAASVDEADRIYNNTLRSHSGHSYNDDVRENHGGNYGHEGIKHTKETKQQMRSGVRKKEHNGFSGKQHAPEIKDRIREYRKSQRWAVNPVARSEIVLPKDAPLPIGYMEGRLCTTEKTIAKQLRKYKALMGVL